MHIGFVYDLRDQYRAAGFSEDAVAEFDTAETVEAIAAALERTSGSVEMVGTGRQLAARLVAGERFDLVFSIAEGVSGRNREAQVPALCEMFDQPYAMSDALTLSVSLDKAMAKRLVREVGLATAPFALIEHAGAAREVRLPFPLFVKPNAEGTGKGCDAASRVRNARELETAARRLIARYRQPVLVEPFLPGREFTVGILGTGAAAQVIGVLEIRLDSRADAGVYGVATKEGWESLVEQDLVDYGLVDDAEARAAGATALAAWRTLGGRDAGRVDLRSDAAGVPQFMEVNPLAGLHPTHSDLPIIAELAGLDYNGLISGILESAMERCTLSFTSRVWNEAASFSGRRPGTPLPDTATPEVNGKEAGSRGVHLAPPAGALQQGQWIPARSARE